mmetsp:Transcript_32029/g.62544  ORF Transcript_32029/g.62544 Transcript_32029/m.62544 type:complete len:341 (-) Transcript_32029:132-1154(-)
MNFIGLVRPTILSFRSTEKTAWACQQSGMATSSPSSVVTFWRLYVVHTAAPSLIHPASHSSTTPSSMGSVLPMGTAAPTTSGKCSSTRSMSALLPLLPHSLRPTSSSGRVTPQLLLMSMVLCLHLVPAMSHARFFTSGMSSLTSSSASGVFLVTLPSIASADSTEQTPHEEGRSRSLFLNWRTRAAFWSQCLILAGTNSARQQEQNLALPLGGSGSKHSGHVAGCSAPLSSSADSKSALLMVGAACSGLALALAGVVVPVYVPKSLAPPNGIDAAIRHPRFPPNADTARRMDGTLGNISDGARLNAAAQSRLIRRSNPPAITEGTEHKRVIPPYAATIKV